AVRAAPGPARRVGAADIDVFQRVPLVARFRMNMVIRAVFAIPIFEPALADSPIRRAILIIAGIGELLRPDLCAARVEALHVNAPVLRGIDAVRGRTVGPQERREMAIGLGGQAAALEGAEVEGAHQLVVGVEEGGVRLRRSATGGGADEGAARRERYG